MTPKQKELPNKTKAAVLMMVLGPETSGEIVKHLSDSDIETLALEVARLDKVFPEVREQIIDEFYELAIAQEYIAEGGVGNARAVLESAFGSDRANEILSKILTAMQIVPFEFLKKADPQQVLSFIQDEHPQTIALILSYMPISSAAMILGKLEGDLRADVAARIAMMEQTPPEVIKKVEAILEKKISSVLSQELTQAGGPKALVDLLNRCDRTTEKLIIEHLEDNEPELADTIKGMMFIFEDIILLDDRAIQAILREVDMKELGVALKGVKVEVQNKIYTNMSERAMAMLKEDMEFMGPVRLKAVEEAQQKIVAIIRRLEESGEIVLSRGGEEEMLV
ncbi:MAG: flagellar motor switch protein FliG [Armatimonadetes bacterium]|nr:flagellar motor switch protein FliG [Armatimonadota bacterium]MBS1700692.1 flagellar motor switch protein FliG [Armatimonadota bacterium]MBS1728819.1 flagellar motor switch protein FliG [Armatimonadota bacterium]